MTGQGGTGVRFVAPVLLVLLLGLGPLPVVLPGVGSGPASSAPSATPRASPTPAGPTDFRVVYYNSTVDGTTLSYYEWLPAGYNSSRAYPLAVFLHGLSYDASELLLSAGGLETIQNASTFGYLLIALNTRTNSGFYVNSPYSGPQEQDVLDAIAHEESIRDVNTSAVYVFGPSMGSVGAYSIAAHHPGLIRGIGAIAECPEMFMAVYYHYLIGAGASFLTTTDGLLPNQSAQALSEVYYLDAVRYYPQNYSHLLLYAVQGGDDNRCPNNPNYLGYQQSNNTFLNATCLTLANWSQPASCQVPFARLSSENPGEYRWRFVYEPTGVHSLDDLNAADMFRFWQGEAAQGLYCASQGGVPTDCPGPPTIRPVTATPNPVDANATLTVSADAYGGAPPYAYTWSGLPTGCGSVNSSRFDCAPTSPGTYALRASITDANGSAATSTAMDVVVAPPLAVTVSATPTSGDAPLTVAFTTTATGGVPPRTVAWSFGDGGTASGSNVTHTYARTGTFVAREWTNDSGGGRSSATVLVAVGASPLVVAGPGLSTPSVDVGQTVTFTVSALGGTGAYSYLWSGLPPGCPTTDVPVLDCLPTGAGTFSVRVRVSDPAGANATTPASTFTVYPDPSVGPVALGRPALDVGQVETFTLPVSGGRAPYAVAWAGLPAGCAPGNGTTATCAAAAPGEYTVHANVTDASGVTTESPWVGYWVHPWVEIDRFVAAPVPVHPGDPWSLSVTATGGTPPYGFAYTGLPGGCAPVNTSELRCVPSATGTYDISVTVTDAAGATAIAAVLVPVTPAAASGGLGPLSPSLGGAPWLAWIGIAAVVTFGGVALARLRPWRRRP